MNEVEPGHELATTDAQPEIRITKGLTVEAYDKICRDIREQPKWRLDSDTDCDYYDGAQTSREVNQRLKKAGMPSQDSNLIKPTINAVLGMEAKSRTDYKVTSDDESQADIAEGLSAKIKEVETESRADRAMSDAYSSMIRSGIGWIEISREFNPLQYPYRVREVHRNDIFWDWTAREPDLSDARYLRRDKWVDRQQAMAMFPEKIALMENTWGGWNQLDVYQGADTGMVRAYEDDQNWDKQNDDFLNRKADMMRLSELWYRHYEEAYVLLLPDGQAIEYIDQNPYHQQAVGQGLVEVQRALLPRMRVSIWLGPHSLMDVKSPLPHDGFPYIPFWCFRKDRSRAPYGLIRDMRGPQDQIIDLDILLYEVMNSKQVEIDNDALDLEANTYREVMENMSSVRNFTVLNANRRNGQSGFKVTREHQLASQVFQLVAERKERIEAVSGVYRAMLGAHTQADSGVAINSLVEQGSTVLAEPNDNFRYARRLVGQQLLKFIVNDMIGRPAQVAVQQGAKKKVVQFNRQVMTEQGPMMENDVAAAQVKVVLEDIPSTPTFRAQQLGAFAEMVKAAPPEYQQIMYPAMLELSDIPNRHELADQMRQSTGMGGPNPQVMQLQQQMQEMQQQGDAAIGQLQEELAQAKQQLGDRSRENDLKEMALEIQAEKNDTDARLKAEELQQHEVLAALSRRESANRPQPQVRQAKG
jgi:hypothetical protein